MLFKYVLPDADSFSSLFSRNRRSSSRSCASVSNEAGFTQAICVWCNAQERAGAELLDKFKEELKTPCLSA